MASMAIIWKLTPRWRATIAFAAILSLFYFTYSYSRTQGSGEFATYKIPTKVQGVTLRPNLDDGKFHWANVPQQFPVASMKGVPLSKPGSIPRIQHRFEKESATERELRLHRLDLVKGNFTHAWKGYKDHAWLRDEVAPISGTAHNHFGGWAATLVDSLDTLWIMGLQEEFELAVDAVKEIDFTTCALTDINVFETTIRYLGGFLGAYDISEGKYPQLLVKATEMGDMLYKAFDTPNRMPVTRWNFRKAVAGDRQKAGSSTLVSEIGSLSLEFTRLSQATGDPKFFDAIQRIMDVFDAQQNMTKLPGMWPVVVNAESLDFTDYGGFTIGGMADSLYEYLPKQHMLLGGGSQQYRKLYLDSMVPMKRHIFYRPMTKSGENIRFAGNVNTDGKSLPADIKTDPQAQHLGCFAGGMVAIGSKIFPDQDDMVLARQLVEGCLWGYEISPLGVLPEIIHTVPCSNDDCAWDEEKWHAQVKWHFGGENLAETIQKHSLPPGIAKFDDTRYILRPEAIESVFILYRITGDSKLRERAWNMFESIIRNTLTDIAHAGMDDCTKPGLPLSDRMESFWLAETLKYFYLIFADPELLSLDEFVLNTEAHPLRRPA